MTSRARQELNVLQAAMAETAFDWTRWNADMDRRLAETQASLARWQDQEAVVARARQGVAKALGA